MVNNGSLFCDSESVVKRQAFPFVAVSQRPGSTGQIRSATMKVLGKALDPDTLIQCVGDEYDRRGIANGTGKGKSQDVIRR